MARAAGVPGRGRRTRREALMLAALRPMLVMLAAVRHVAGLVSPRRLAGHTIHRSKHWPSDGIIRQVYLAAATTAIEAAARYTWRMMPSLGQCLDRRHRQPTQDGLGHRIRP